jgi:thioredoxin reductase
MAKGEMMFDVVIVGGSYAGMSAALQLARARRKVAVVDAGQRRNRFAATSHGFLTRDGQSPAAIAREAREQLLAYPTVKWVDGSVETAGGAPDDFAVSVAGGETLTGRRLILAHGVSDQLPAIPGLAELWGRHVFHCPYCHGYELDQGDIGVLAVGEISMHHALMLPDWGRTTFFTNGILEPDEKQLRQLAHRGTAIEPTRVVSARETNGRLALALEDGREAALAGLFVASTLRLASQLAAAIGCEIETGPMGETIRTDVMKASTVPGVFACGDAARMAGSLTFAVADGAMAGAAAHRSLMLAGLD